MYSADTKTQSTEKIGRVTIAPRENGSLQLRFSYLGKRYKFTLGEDNKLNRKAAQAKAQEINADITFERLDTTLAKYSPSHAKIAQVVGAQSRPQLKTVWEEYKEDKKSEIAYSTQKVKWSNIDRLLFNYPFNPTTDKDSVTGLCNWSLEKYKPSYVSVCLETLSTVLNHAINKGLDCENPIPKIKKELDKKKPKKLIECFTDDDVKNILLMFEGKISTSSKKDKAKLHYYPFVKFCALTGCRPEEAIALTFDDIITQQDKLWIKFNKAYSQRKLRDKTKTGEVRLFPVNSQLKQFLDNYTCKTNNLLFPGKRGNYFDYPNFTSNYWSHLITCLVKDGLVSQYLSFYHLRHTFITNLIRKGYDIATVAKLAGNSPQVIIDSYLAAISDVTVPDFNF